MYLTCQPLELHVLPAHRCHFFSRSLFSPPLPWFYLCILPAFRPPSRRERERERGQENQIQTLSSSSSAPLAQNNSSNPERVPESYWTRFCACVCAHVCLCSLWTGPGYTLNAAGFGSSCQLPRSFETRYIRPRKWLGAPCDSGTQNERAKAVQGQTVTVSLCIPPSANSLSVCSSLPLFLLPLCSCWNMLDRANEMENGKE